MKTACKKNGDIYFCNDGDKDNCDYFKACDCSLADRYCKSHLWGECTDPNAWLENQEVENRIKKAKDMFNQEIKVGDIIIYPVRKKNDMYMRTARVLSGFEEDGITKLKVLVAIPPRASERRSNRNWRQDIRLVKTIVSKSWRAKIVDPDLVCKDSRYNVLLDK